MSQVAAPAVSIRLPRSSLIAASVLAGLTASFATAVVVDGWTRSAGTDRASVTGSILFVGFLVVLPCAWVVAAARTGVRSHGTELRLRSGLTTRTVPAQDIDGFVIVDRVGARDESYPCRAAIALRRGSESFRRDMWSDRPRWAQLVRRGLLALTSRKPGDVPVPATHATYRSWGNCLASIAALQAWHDWALVESAQNCGIAGATG